MKKNLVMGSGSGFSWNIFEPFVTSFVKYAKNTELVLFVKDLSDFTIDRIKRCGGECIKLEPFKYTNNIGIERYKNFKRYIEVHGEEYGKIFITDTRDVIFQGDVFERFKDYSNFLCYSTEADNIIGSKSGNSDNYKWLINAFGKEEADKLAYKKIICAGSALLGTTSEMKIFLERLFANNSQEYPFGFDQASFNYLIYNHLVPVENLIESDIVSGEIFTIGFVKKYSVQNDFILRGDGGVPPVVHQYDRFPTLIDLVDRLYRDKNFQIDERFTDARSTLDQILCLLHSEKITEATWLFMKKTAEGSNLTEDVGSLIKIWEIVLRYTLIPAVGYLELAVQSALASFGNFSSAHLTTICRLLQFAIKNRRAIYPPFVNHIASILWNIAESSLKENVPAQCFLCIDLINSFELPPDKDFYLFAAKVNRTFGRKEEALELYKKALDLS